MYITIIEDWELFSRNISKKLSKNWFNIKILKSFNDFINENFFESDLYIINTSFKNNFDIITFLREVKNNNSPIIIISEINDIEKRVSSINLWADDYLIAPFYTEELIAKIRSLLRRSYKIHQSSKIIYKDLIYDITNKIIEKKWKKINLTSRETQLAEFLIFNVWKLITKYQLMISVWWEYDLLQISDNNINVTISNLRKKLWKDFDLKTLVNKWYTLYK